MYNSNNSSNKIKENKMIKKCSCKHKFQDKRYGIGMRVHNPAVSKIDKDKKAWVCTVCNKRSDFMKKA